MILTSCWEVASQNGLLFISVADDITFLALSPDELQLV